MTDSVKVINAALDETEEGDIILRGVLDPSTLHNLHADDYQREILPQSKVMELVRAFDSGSVPDIELGMRGQRVIERGDAFFLQDSVYIVDGLQRVTAAIYKVRRGDEKHPRLGATVHFGTTKEWERDRFRILNAERTKLSSNILLRNMREDLEVVQVLYSLTTKDKSFVLYDRVSWNQRMRRQDLITALTFASSIGALHSHAGPGRSSRFDALAKGLQVILKNVGPNVFRDNVRTFYELIDQCWGVKRVAFKEGAIYMRTSFLETFATLLSRHPAFWRDEKLFVEASLARKIASFPITDPQVINLAGSGGKARDMLYILLRDHINSGKRSKRLRERSVETIDLSEEDEEMLDSMRV